MSYDTVQEKGYRRPNLEDDFSYVCDNDNMYWLGKSRINTTSLHRQKLNELWKFNFSSRTWEKLKVRNMPPSIIICPLLIENNALFALTNLDTFRIVITCNLNTEDLYFVPVAIYIHKPHFLINPLEVPGMITELRNGGLFSTHSDRWNMINRMVRPENKRITVVNNWVYLFGTGHGFLQIVSFYDIQNLRADTTIIMIDGIEGYPEPRTRHSLASSRGNIYIFGGISTKGVVLKCVWKFYTRHFRWRKMYSLSLPTPLHSHKTVVVPSTGIMYTFGGYTDVEERNPSTKMYTAHLEPAKLRSFSWDAAWRYLGPERLRELLPSLLKDMVEID